jgi:hypothetical protein
MWKKIVFLVFVLVIISSVGLANNNLDKNNYYRNEKYKFSILFPVGWEERDNEGYGVYTIKKAVNRNGRSAIGIAVKDFYKEMFSDEERKIINRELINLEDKEIFSDEVLIMLIEEIVKQLRNTFSNVKIFEKNIRNINDKKAIYIKCSYIYNFANKKVDMIAIQYHFIHKGYMFTITGNSLFSSFNEDEKLMKQSISSFKFED